MTEPVFGPPPGLASETPCDAAPPEPRGVRSRIAAGLGVGLVGVASLSTAVYQTITQASTTVGVPDTVAEVDTPLPWGTPVAAPALPASTGPTTITPTVADLDLRADRRPLPEPVESAVPPAAGAPAPVGAAPDPRPERPTSNGDRRPVPSPGTSPGTSTGTTRPTTRPTTPPSSTPPSSEQPPSESPSESPSTSPSPREAPEPPATEPPTSTPAAG